MYRFIASSIFGCLFIFSLNICGQAATSCTTSAVPAVVHSEGLAEPMGAITLQCTGAPGLSITTNLTIYLPINITNQIDANGYSTDALLDIAAGTTTTPTGINGLVTNQSISFSGVQLSFPANGQLAIVLSNLRADANQLGLQQTSPIQAFISSTGLPIVNNQVTVAFARQGLFATAMDSGVTCSGSPTPSTVTVTNLISAGTAEQTTRVTEGFAGAFLPKDPNSETGTRFLLTYANVPSGVTIYVPDAVAGSTALVPSSGGDLGTAAATGQYQQGSNTLLLVRVLNTDSNGVGGTFATLPPPNSSGMITLSGANPVPLSSGAGYAVYEVVAADTSTIENAQIPNYFAVPPNTNTVHLTILIRLAMSTWQVRERLRGRRG